MEVIQLRIDARALGDNLAWIPYFSEYQERNGVRVIASTFFNDLFAPAYPELIFANPNNPILNTDRVIYVGVDPNGTDSLYSHSDWRGQPLQKTASDILGLEYAPRKPKVFIPDIEIPYGNYICISEHTTMPCKYWNHPNGWQIVVDYCNSIGVKVVVCSKEPTKLKGVIDRTGDYPIVNRAALLSKARAHIGVSSGLSWLAWATDTPVVMISGATEAYHEFPCHRVINESVCTGCINKDTRRLDESLSCDLTDERKFECTTKITPEMVIMELNKSLG